MGLSNIWMIHLHKSIKTNMRKYNVVMFYFYFPSVANWKSLRYWSMNFECVLLCSKWNTCLSSEVPRCLGCFYSSDPSVVVLIMSLHKSHVNRSVFIVYKFFCRSIVYVLPSELFGQYYNYTMYLTMIRPWPSVVVSN